MDAGKIIRNVLATNRLAQLATQSNGNLWLCTICFVSDSDNHIYWLSRRDRQHSQEIVQNPSTALTVLSDDEPKVAVQLSGQAGVVADTDIDQVHNLYTAKFGTGRATADSIRNSGPDGATYWILTPTTTVLWDETTFPDQPKQYA